ncbi:MAG: hypothetical protein HYV63_26340 [Candidatus Schekmanbacteria bacterium]|nr:hypothetical protein [Candidatus Schekmanbacteria bacterium]
MNLLVCIATVLMVLVLPAAGNPAEPAAAPAGKAEVRWRQDQQGRRLDFAAPGSVASVAFLRRPDGARDVLVLIRSAADESVGNAQAALYRLAFVPDASAEPLRGDVPAATRSVLALSAPAANRLGMLALALPGKLLGIEPGPEGRYAEPIRMLVADSELDLRSMGPDPQRPEYLEAPAALWIPLIGKLRAYAVDAGARDAAGPLWRAVADVGAPVQPHLEDSLLELVGPPINALPEPAAEGRVRLLLGPDLVGHRRVRTVTLELSADQAPASETSWGQLPSRQEILEHAYLAMHGASYLAVLTRSADKLSLFGEKLLQVFRLQADRTRQGLPPVMSLESRINLWQDTWISAHDVNEDGLEDLILAYWKGLTKDHLAIDTYVATAVGQWRQRPGTTAIALSEMDRSVLLYGSDLDGDRLADLSVVGNDAVLVFSGRRGARNGGDLLADSACRTFSIGHDPFATTKPGATSPRRRRQISIAIGGPGRGASVDTGAAADKVAGRDSPWAPVFARNPWPVDLDGDGRLELVMAGTSRPGEAYLLAVSPSPCAGTP